MEDYNFIEEIEKSKKFISTKISNGFIKVNNIGKNVASIFIDKETCVFKENSDDEYKAIYLYQEAENNLYDFKNEIEKSKKFLSANSFIILRYVDLYNDNIEYIENIESGHSVIEEEYENTREDDIEEFMFMGLRMNRGISEEKFKEKFGVTIDSIYKNVINKNINLGLLKRDCGKIYLSDLGIELSNSVMSDMIL